MFLQVFVFLLVHAVYIISGQLTPNVITDFDEMFRIVWQSYKEQLIKL